jgi:hypothetical protein
MNLNETIRDHLQSLDADKKEDLCYWSFSEGARFGAELLISRYEKQKYDTLMQGGTFKSVSEVYLEMREGQ